MQMNPDNQQKIQQQCQALLEKGAMALQLQLETHQINQLMAYLALLVKWNAVYNLTSVRDPLEMVKQHLLDSLATIFAFHQANNILDVGSGGGFPGMVLAIVYPDKQLSLVDKVHKKTAFLKQVKAELSLKNVIIHTERVERLHTNELFDVITSRAFSELSNFVNWAGHLLTPKGQMIALKGQLPEDEINVLPAQWKVTRTQSITVPELDANRHLVWLVHH